VIGGIYEQVGKSYGNESEKISTQALFDNMAGGLHSAKKNVCLVQLNKANALENRLNSSFY